MTKLLQNTRALLIWLLPVVVLVLTAAFVTACDNTAPANVQPAATVEVDTEISAAADQVAIEAFDQPQAFLADEQNTVDVVNAFGPAVAAINVSVQGQAMRPFEDIPEDQLPPEFRDILPFLDEEVPTVQSSGSGFLIKAKGAKPAIWSPTITSYKKVCRRERPSSFQGLP